MSVLRRTVPTVKNRRRGPFAEQRAELQAVLDNAAAKAAKRQEPRRHRLVPHFYLQVRSDRTRPVQFPQLLVTGAERPPSLQPVVAGACDLHRDELQKPALISRWQRAQAVVSHNRQKRRRDRLNVGQP